MSGVANISSIQQKKNLDDRFFNKNLFAAAEKPVPAASRLDIQENPVLPDLAQKIIKAFRKFGVKDLESRYGANLQKITYFYSDRPSSGTYKNTLDGRLVIIVNPHDIDVLSKKFRFPEEDNVKFRKTVLDSILGHEIAHLILDKEFPKLGHPAHEVIATSVATKVADPEYLFFYASYDANKERELYKRAADAAAVDVNLWPQQDFKNYALITKILKTSISQVLKKLGDNVANYDFSNANQLEYADVNFKFDDDRKRDRQPQSLSETFETVAARFFNSHIRGTKPPMPTILGKQKWPETPQELIKMFVSQYAENVESEAKKIMKKRAAFV